MIVAGENGMPASGHSPPERPAPPAAAIPPDDDEPEVRGTVVDERIWKDPFVYVECDRWEWDRD